MSNKGSHFKSAYNSLIIGPRGYGYEASLQEIMGWDSFDVVIFDLVSFGDDFAIGGNELASGGSDLVSDGYNLVSGGNNLVSSGNKLLSGEQFSKWWERVSKGWV